MQTIAYGIQHTHLTVFVIEKLALGWLQFVALTRW